jgi:eukaryotic-like serine/threonine-protein kinase
VASQATRCREPILGYEVIERIGAGGYGEVWKATAPGGLCKAIKFVYGFLDDERATRELKALSRVKLVRHPFLLSLERIEVVDGQLVIITELADLSLKDRHEQCKAAGMVGVPREELLGYLRDAADALDYMREKYSLQHLDVKPENLLLVGGHVKVADFGLVKDINDTRASMMGGLTPIYASPEVFDDRPSQCSDQYSLAIVYQELLTDTLPFPGKTTAQLAAQHLQSRARLTALPPQDKPIIDRALSKAPEARFPDCRAMVDALIAAGRSKTSSRNTTTSGDTKPLAAHDTHPVRPANTPQPQAQGTPEGRTQTLDECRVEISTRAGESSAPTAPRVRLAPTIRDLEPLVVSAETFLRPTLFVGIGGTATVVLGQLRRRLQDRFGRLDKMPALRLLAIDTDTESLAESTQQGDESGLTANESLALPLRRSEEYRGGSVKLLEWMSRRWLYNIPRSLQTEGLRPLGRLALVDHGKELATKLRAALAAITDPQAVAATAEFVGMPLHDAAPRVVLVASISGGTGSGMALDAAYLLDKLTKERGLPAESLNVVLLHSTGRNPGAHDLAVANAHATLTELAHYFERGYPGEPACDLPPLEPEQARLPGTYLVHLGGELGESELPAAAGSVADYLYLTCATPAAGWFDAARSPTSEAEGEAAARDVALRTFGVYHLGCSRDLIAAAADETCVALIERWCGERQGRRPEPATSHNGNGDGAASSGAWSNAEIDRQVRGRIAMMALSTDDIMLGLQQVAERTFGGNVDGYLRDAVAKALSASPKEGTAEEDQAERHPLLVAIDQLVAPAIDAETVGDTPTLATAIEAHVKESVRLQAGSVRAWAAELVDQPGARLKGATRAVDGVVRQVRELRDTAQNMRSQTGEQMRSVVAALARSKLKTRGWSGLGGANQAATELQTRLVQYADLKFLDTVLTAVTKFAQLLSWELSSIGEQLTEAQRELTQTATAFASADNHARRNPAQGNDAASAIATGVREMLHAQVPAMATRLDAYFQQEFTRRHGGLASGLAQGAEFHKELATAMHVQARATVLDVIRAAGIGQKMLAKDSGDDRHDLMRACLAEATPGLMACGGDRRLLMVTSEQTDAGPLAQAVTEVTSRAPSLVVDPAGEPVLCYEVAGMPLANAAASLVENQPHCAQLAARLHTRCDIDWLPLTYDV